MKLVNHIKAIETGNRSIIVDPLHTIKYTSEIDRDYIPSFAKEYSITVTIGTNVWIEDNLIKSSGSKVVDLAVEEMKYAIIEHVYGDLNRDLHELKFLLRNELGYRETETSSIKKLEEIIDKISL